MQIVVSVEVARRAPNRTTIGVIVLAVWPMLFGAAGCQQAPAEDRAFQQARQLVVTGKYQQGAKALQAYLDDKPTKRNSSRAGLFLFKAHAALGDYQEATKWCEWTIREHATTLEAHKCRYKLAVLAMIQGDHADALKRFGQLADQADGPLAAEATAMRDFLKGKRLVENDAQQDR